MVCGLMLFLGSLLGTIEENHKKQMARLIMRDNYVLCDNLLSYIPDLEMTRKCKTIFYLHMQMVREGGRGKRPQKNTIKETIWID